MNKRALILVATFLVFLWSSTALAAQPNLVPDTRAVEVNKQVTTEISHEDADWPITRIERYQDVDPETKEVTVHTTTVRESPPTYQPPNERLLSCVNTSTSLASIHSETPLLACTWYSSMSIENSHTIGSITSRGKHYADRYCSGGTCTYYKPYKLEAWWTRTNSNWNAQNATINWGCIACTECEGGAVSPVYTDGPYTPTWQSSTLSHYYVYTSSTFPIMQATFFGMVNGIIDSDAYENTTYKGHMKVQTAF